MEKKKNNLITVDVDKLKKLSKDGKDIFFKPEAEKTLLELLKLKELVDEAMTNAKHVLEEAGLKQNPNFTAIKGDKIKVGYRYFGQAYGIDESQVAAIPPELYKKQTKISYGVVTKELNNWLKTHDNLPVGINEYDRKKSITISKIKQDEE